MGLIQAFTADGQQMWEATIYGGLAGRVVPDAYGGLLILEACDPNDPLYSPLEIAALDGVTGMVLWQRPVSTGNVCLPGLPRLAVRADGAVAIAMPLQISPAMLVVDGLTGVETVRPPIPPSVFGSQFGSTSSDGFTPIGQPIVDSEGSIQVEYAVRQTDPNQQQTTVLSLLTITAGGSMSARELNTSTTGNLWPGQIIPDGQAGLLATWVNAPTSQSTTHPYQAAHVSSSGVTVFDMPLAPENAAVDALTNLPLPLSLVLGETANSAFVSYGTDLVAFDLTSGNPSWSYSAAPLPLTIVASEANGGVAAKTTSSDGTQTIIRLSSGGTPTTAAWTGTSVNHLVVNQWSDTTATDAINVRTAETLDLSTTGWFSPDQKGTFQAQELVFMTDPKTTGPEQVVITNLLIKIKSALETESTIVLPRCADWLRSAGDVRASTFIQDYMLNGNHFGHGIVTPERVVAYKFGVNPGNVPTGMPGDWTMGVNRTGAFFRQRNSRGNSWPQMGPGNYNPATLQFQASTLIHEVAHILGANNFLPDFGKPLVGVYNDTMVWYHCRYLIGGLQP